MAQNSSEKEDYLDLPDGKLWYRINGSGSKTPILVLHGGPGAAHDYLDSLVDLASSSRQVVFYDQMGCGKSARPDDPDKWTVEYFSKEIDVVREKLGLDKVHLLGQSWGGMLAMAYMETKPSGIVSLTIASSPASVPKWMKELERLRAELPQDVQGTLLKHEQNGTTDSSEYEEASMVFYKRHLCRMEDWPEPLSRSLGPQLGKQVYNTMNGPNEFHVIGTLKTFDVEKGLSDIKEPTLVTGGAYDEITPSLTKAVHEAIDGSEYKLFERSSHVAHWEERELFMNVVQDFITKVEGKA